MRSYFISNHLKASPKQRSRQIKPPLAGRILRVWRRPEQLGRPERRVGNSLATQAFNYCHFCARFISSSARQLGRLGEGGVANGAPASRRTQVDEREKRARRSYLAARATIWSIRSWRISLVSHFHWLWRANELGGCQSLGPPSLLRRRFLSPPSQPHSSLHRGFGGAGDHFISRATPSVANRNARLESAGRQTRLHWLPTLARCSSCSLAPVRLSSLSVLSSSSSLLNSPSSPPPPPTPTYASPSSSFLLPSSSLFFALAAAHR